MMKSARATVGRSSAKAVSRSEQLRLAKRAQREREREAGMVTVPVRLATAEAARLRAAMRQPDFNQVLNDFLDQEQIEVSRYENLAALCWNRRDKYLPAEEAFQLYERNWRHVDAHRLQPAEHALIERLIARHGNGVLNV